MTERPVGLPARGRYGRRLGSIVVLLVLVAGCSKGGSPVTRPGPPTSTTASTTASTTVPSPTTQTVTVTPAVGLKSPQTVLVRASGFSPGESLIVAECAAKGGSTGPGDCDLSRMQSVTADSGGTVSVEFTVTKGPFGANAVVCGPTQACLVSVTQATLSPTQEADARINFA